MQNKDDVSYNAAKPVVTEVGPYTFIEYYNKFGIKWYDDGNLVEFTTQTYYIFDESLSNPGLTLNDKITLPYLPAIGFEYLLSSIPMEYQLKLQDKEKVGGYSHFISN